MSGSFDPPNRGYRPPALPTGQGLDPHGDLPHGEAPHADPVTAPPAYHQRHGYGGEALQPDGSGTPHHAGYTTTAIDEGPAEYEITAPARSRRGERSVNGPVVPAGSVTGRSLTLVISIMCFLACLTAGAVYLINKSASAWLRDVASEVTVQVEPLGANAQDIDTVTNRVAEFLRGQSGIASAQPLGVEASTALLEPWLGKTEGLKTLPIPRLIAVVVNRDEPPDFDTLSDRLSTAFPSGVRLDDHRQWQQQIKTVTRSFALGGVAILILVAAATTAIIVSATRAAMASNRDIVEVLHFVGATDGFIAREFEKHFLRLGVRAGLIGAVSALAVFLLLPTLMLVLGGGSMTLIELERLAGGGALDLAGYVLLGMVVVVIAGLCMLTSRYGVYRILNSKP